MCGGGGGGVLVRPLWFASFLHVLPAVFHGGWLVVPDPGTHSPPPLPQVEVDGASSVQLEVVYLRPMGGQGKRVGNSVGGGPCWDQ